MLIDSILSFVLCFGVFLFSQEKKTSSKNIEKKIFKPFIFTADIDWFILMIN